MLQFKRPTKDTLLNTKKKDTMEQSNLSNGSITLNDVMYRRLKNRERQRRYRQRKRVKAGSSNAHVTNQSSQMQIVPLPTNGTVERFVTRVHCKRDWKKDARRVHAANAEATSNGLPSHCHSSPCKNHTPPDSLGMQEKQTLKNEAPSGNYSRPSDAENTINKRRRRDWKAEARQKK